MTGRLIWLVALLSMAVVPSAWADQTVEYRDGSEVVAVFTKLGYTPKRWQSGIREVPRIYNTTIPERWRNETSKSITVLQKKRAFFLILAPQVLLANENVTKERTRARSIVDRLATGEGVSAEDDEWIKQIAVRYRVIKTEDDKIDPDDYVELMTRLDIVPVSLALAQAASESGWGTSRFADVGNAMFGMWAWGEAGIPPEQQRKELGNYGIASYKTVQESVNAYVGNLNSHPAYKDFRLRRAEMRQANMRLTGIALAETLLRYSERGQAYVDELKNLITANRLAAADQAYLTEMESIYLVPVGEGSK